MKLKKSTFRILGVAAILVAVLGIASLVMAADTIDIVTTPIKLQEPIYLDENADGIHDANEFIGNYDVYDGNLTITFNWLPYAFAEGANGSYRVSLVQNTTPLGPEATWTEIVIGHHWASNPNGTTFTMGPFSRHTTCTYCPSHFVVQPETFEEVLNADTNAYEYVYTPVAAALGGAALTLEESEDFTIEIFYVPPPSKDESCEDSGVNCGAACGGYDQCLAACEAAGDCNPEIACSGPEACLATCYEGGFGQTQTGETCESSGCEAAWAVYCELVAIDAEDYLECLAFYPEAVLLGFCEACADDPVSCAVE